MTEQEMVYIRPEQKIYEVALNKNEINWKSFLYELIYKEGLDPWDIDLGILTKKYLEALKDLKDIDFDISGKFLTIAVFLLKTKAESLVEKDLRGFNREVELFKNSENDFENDLEELEEIEQKFEAVERKKREKYSLKFRNPIARKRKVNIFDLIKILEKTFEQSNKRRTNFLQRSANIKYSGPLYEKKPKDLKTLIEELFDLISSEIKEKTGHVTFSHIATGINHKMGILEKFIPLLHLRNQNRINLEQDKHFGEIKIHKNNLN